MKNVPKLYTLPPAKYPGGKVQPRVWPTSMDESWDPDKSEFKATSSIFPTFRVFENRGGFIDYHEDFDALDIFIGRLGRTKTEVEGTCFEDVFPMEFKDVSWTKEHELEERILASFEKDTALASRSFCIQPQGKESDSKKRDLIVSRQISHDGDENLPVSVLTLKFGELEASGLDQMTDCVIEVLGNHCEIEKLPFVIMSEFQFIVGIAVWESFEMLKVFKSKKVYDIYKRDGTRNSELLKNLYRFVFWNSEPRRKIISERNGTQYKLMRIVGMGASCTAYLAEVSVVEDIRNKLKRKPCGEQESHEDTEVDNDCYYNCPEGNDDGYSIKVNPIYRALTESLIENPSPLGNPVILKFSSGSTGLKKDLEIDGLLDPEFRVGWHKMCTIRYDHFFIVGPVLTPIRRSMFWDPNNCATLQHNDMEYLLQNLLHIHSKGYAHRDVRLQNILQNRSGKFILSDFGSADLLDTKANCCGTVETASQRVLHYIISYPTIGRIEVKAEDDLESLLKCYLIAFMGVSPPIEKDDLKDLFTFWMGTPLIPSFLRLRGIDAKVEFLRDLFINIGGYEDAVKTYKTLITNPPAQ